VKIINDGRIKVVQFEYNGDGPVNKASLPRNCFRFIQGRPYRLGKLIGPRLPFFDVWQPGADEILRETTTSLSKR